MSLINKARSHSVVPGADLVRLRLALTAFFALDGFVFAGWVVRIPAVKEQTGASASALGLALLGVSAGAVITMTVGRLFGTTLLERLGRTRTVLAGGSTAAAGMLLGAPAPSLWAALLGYAVTGLGLANPFPVAVERAGALATASALG